MCVIKNLNGKKVLGRFMTRNCKGQISYTLCQQKKKKCDKLYVQRKEYDNSFNSQVDKKDIERISYKSVNIFLKDASVFVEIQS